MLTKKDTVDPLDAPDYRKVAATGMTPQEHNGAGTPKIVDLKIDKKLFCPICLTTKRLSIKIDMSPANNIPNSRYGAASILKDHISSKKRFIYLKTVFKI